MSSPEDQNLAPYLALLGATTYAALQSDLGPAAPTLPDPNLERIWRSLLIEFNALHMDRVRARLGEHLDSDLFDLHWGREQAWHAEFLSRSYLRLRDDLDVPVTSERLGQILQRERHYAGLHFLAAARRARSVIEHVRLRQDDQRSDTTGGALWLVSPLKKTHTADCLAANGKVWSWRVLRFFNPANRHPGCGCQLFASNLRPIDRPPAGMTPGFDMGQIEPRRPVVFHVPSAADLMGALR